jgi:hypothetical protein
LAAAIALGRADRSHAKSASHAVDFAVRAETRAYDSLFKVDPGSSSERDSDGV